MRVEGGGHGFDRGGLGGGDDDAACGALGIAPLLRGLGLEVLERRDGEAALGLGGLQNDEMGGGAELQRGGAPAQGFLATSAGVATTNSGAATAVTADGLLTLKHAIKTAYSRNANFLLNRTTLGSVRKLKDSTGQYLWMPGIAQGKPNSIDGDPYVEMADMPSEAAGAKAVAYGDFRRAYTWADRISMELLRDPYTQATLGNIRFQLRKRVGGKVVLPEAIRTLTCAAA